VNMSTETPKTAQLPMAPTVCLTRRSPQLTSEPMLSWPASGWQQGLLTNQGKDTGVLLAKPPLWAEGQP
jgi:hypothetical protein